MGSNRTEGKKYFFFAFLMHTVQNTVRTLSIYAKQRYDSNIGYLIKIKPNRGQGSAIPVGIKG